MSKLVTEAVPEWSGDFVVSDDQSAAFMSIHWADRRKHAVPAGWSLVEQTSYPDDRCEVLIYGPTLESAAWSGEFWETTEGIGFMSVHMDDERLHSDPPGQGSPVQVCWSDNAETYVYRRTTSAACE